MLHVLGWSNEWNRKDGKGDIAPTTAESPNYHNSGIQMFRAYLITVPKDLVVNKQAIVPGLKCGYRGRLWKQN